MKCGKLQSLILHFCHFRQKCKMQEKSQGDSTQYPAETLLSSLTSLRKKSEDRRGICRTSCATSIPPRRRGPCKLFEAHGLTAYGPFPRKPLQEQAPVRACAKKAQRFALSFKLFAEREEITLLLHPFAF